MPRKWIIKKSHLSMNFTCIGDGVFMGEFAALPGCEAMGRTYDEVVMNLAQKIADTLRAKLDGDDHESGSDQAA